MDGGRVTAIAVPDSPAPRPAAKPLRILMIQVGNPIDDDDSCESRLRMRSWEGGDRWYRKKDVVNATDQMCSLEHEHVHVDYGFLSNRKSIGALLRAGKRLRQEAGRGDVQLVHVLWGITTSLMAVLFSPVPVVVSFSGSDLFGAVDEHGRRTWQGRVSRSLSQLSALGASRIIVKSARMRDVLWPPSRRKAVVIPNGVDLARFRPEPRAQARRRLRRPDSEKLILFFTGGGAAVKNRPLAEAVAARVQQDVPASRLWCVDGVPHEELADYYNAADALLLTSFHEGSNNSLKEALCCNLPVVSVDCGDARERLSGVRNCVVVAGRHEAELASALVDILRRGERSDGRTHVASLALDAIAARVRAVYDDTLSAARSR
jgi:glycosyltransferase involved in cell wall biosynthesis